MPPTSPEADQSVDLAMPTDVEVDAHAGTTTRVDVDGGVVVDVDSDVDVGVDVDSDVVVDVDSDVDVGVETVAGPTVISELKGGLARILGGPAVDRPTVSTGGPATTADPGDIRAAVTGGMGSAGVKLVQPENDLEGLARVLSAQPPFLEVLQGHDGEDAMERHKLEYQEPSIWLWRRIVGASFAFIVVTATWYLIKLPSGLIGDDALPTLTQTATAFNELRSTGFAGHSMFEHLGASMLRLAVGLGLGSVLGIVFGLVAGAAPLARTIVDPVASFFRMVPGVAAAPLAVVWFGVGEGATMAVVTFSVMWAVTGTVGEIRTRMLRGSKLELTAEVIGSLRSSLLLAWVTVLAVETIVSSSGLGPMIWAAQDRTDMVVVGVALAGLVGFAVDTLVRTFHYTLVNKV